MIINNEVHLWNIDLNMNLWCFIHYQNPKEHIFFDIWTQKEAMSKCIGVGISENVLLTDTQYKNKIKLKYNINFASINIDKEYKASLAYQSNSKPKLKFYNFSEKFASNFP